MGMINYKTKQGKEIIKKVLGDMEHNCATSYNEAREHINLLLEEKVLKEVLFEIQDSHVTCTVSSNPNKIEFPRYFEQDTPYHQTTASGKTEQEAFYSALSKLAIFAKLS